MAESQFVVLKIGQEKYGANVQQVKSIERISRISPVLDGPNFLKGVVDVRGDSVPVIDLRERVGSTLGQTLESENERRILLVNVNDIIVGLMVDGIENVIAIDDTWISPMPTLFGAFRAAYLNGVAKLQDRLLVLLNLEDVLSDAEVQKLQMADWTPNVRTS